VPGYVLPPDVLIKEGMANYNSATRDESWGKMQKHDEWNRVQRLKEQEEFFASNRGKLRGNFGIARKAV